MSRYYDVFGLSAPIDVGGVEGLVGRYDVEGHVDFIEWAGPAHHYVKRFSLDNAELLQELSKSKKIVFAAIGSVELLVSTYLNEEKVGSSLYKPGELSDFSVPDEIDRIDFSYRVSGELSIISGITMGDESSLRRKVNLDSRFKGASTDLEKIVVRKGVRVAVETVFCDSETRRDVLDKYASYLIAQIESISRSCSFGFVWFIHVSADKDLHIKLFNEKIRLLNAADFIKVNVYEHPENGYEGGSSNIDKIVKPNVTDARRREGLFRSALTMLPVEWTNYAGIFIRGVVDDDDFLSPRVINRVQEDVISNLGRSVGDGNIFIGYKRVAISYFCVGSPYFLCQDVEFDRVICGAKFSAGLGGWNASAFSIPENHSDMLSIGGLEVPYVIVETDFPVVSYNRTFGNLSSNSKAFFCRHVYRTRLLSSHDDLFAFLNE